MPPGVINLFPNSRSADELFRTFVGVVGGVNTSPPSGTWRQAATSLPFDIGDVGGELNVRVEIVGLRGRLWSGATAFGRSTGEVCFSSCSGAAGGKGTVDGIVKCDVEAQGRF